MGEICRGAGGSAREGKETKEEEGANRDAKLGKWRKHTCSGRLIGGPHACSIVDSTLIAIWNVPGMGADYETLIWGNTK